MYIYNNQIHNSDEALIIASIIQKLYQPVSILDVGCGNGTFIKAFKQLGITDILGLDGRWVDEKLFLDNYKQHFLVTDLNQELPIARKYDLTICLEVAEHLHASRAESLVKELTASSNRVIFSAAIPLQGGQDHINEQWQEFWISLFNKQDFKPSTVLRNTIWSNSNLKFWYKQNMIVFERAYTTSELIDIYNVVHPDHFEQKAVYLQKLLSGEFPIKKYFIMLGKALLKKMRII